MVKDWLWISPVRSFIIVVKPCRKVFIIISSSSSSSITSSTASQMWC